MTLIWTTALFIGGISYLFLLLRVINGLKKLDHGKKTHSSSPIHRADDGIINSTTTGTDVIKPMVSVVIAARNEETEIGGTLASVLKQDYPTDRYEVIVVDDRSSDRTAEIVENIAKDDTRVRLIRQRCVKPCVSPKKQALELGFRATSCEIIVTTDADCRPHTGWLQALIRHFTPDVGMVTGQARFDIGASPPLWQRLQALDYMSQGIAAAGLIADEIPFSCTGASLAFRVALFDEVGGYTGVERLISGDDELLLMKANRSHWRIVTATERDAIVPTRPPTTLRELWQQRMRWGSKGLYYRLSRKLILSGIFIFFLALIIGPLISALSGLWIVWIVWFLAKLISDAIVVNLGCHLYHESYRWIDFIILELIHPFFMVLFAIGGHFSSFEWKEQTFRSRTESI